MVFRHVLRSVVLFLTVFLFAAVSNAQSILVVDQARVLRESNVGKHIQNQLLSIGTQMDTEVKSTGGSIQSEYEGLIAQTKGMTAEQRKARPDLEKRALELQKKMQDAQMEMAFKQRDLDATKKKAYDKVNEKLSTILKAIVAERGADLLVDRSLVMFTSPSLDITDEVIKRLNGEMRTVSVTRERLPRR